MTRTANPNSVHVRSLQNHPLGLPVMNLHSLKYPHYTLLSFSALVLISLTGCGEKPTPTGTLEGTLLLNGNPYTDGITLNLINPSTGKPAVTEVDKTGAFKFQKPIEVGEYKAFVAPIATEMTNTDAPPPPIKHDPKIPDKYLNDLNTDLKVTIKEGENKDVKLDMKP